MNEKTNESKKSSIFDFKSLMKNEKAIKTILLGGVALIALFFLLDLLTVSPTTSQKKPNSQTTADSVLEHENQLEQKLMKAVSAIDGVGELTIVVTLDSLSETVFSERGADVRTVITPKVRGVAIICEGGGDIITKQRVVELVSRVLGISTTKISVTY